MFEFDLDYLSSSTSVAFCSSFKSFASTLSSKVCILLHRRLCLLTIKIFVDLFKTPLLFVKKSSLSKEQNLFLQNLYAVFLQHLSLRQKVKPLFDKGQNARKAVLMNCAVVRDSSHICCECRVDLHPKT